MFAFPYRGFSCGSSGKEATCNEGDLGSSPGLGRSPGERNGNPLQYSCLEIPWTEEPGGLESMRSQRVRHNWATNILTFALLSLVYTIRFSSFSLLYSLYDFGSQGIRTSKSIVNTTHHNKERKNRGFFFIFGLVYRTVTSKITATATITITEIAYVWKVYCFQEDFTVISTHPPEASIYLPFFCPSHQRNHIFFTLQISQHLKNLSCLLQHLPPQLRNSFGIDLNSPLTQVTFILCHIL